MPGSLAHLTARFFDVLTARPLDVAERATVELWLTPELSQVFFDQQPPDQRHGYEAALSVIAQGFDSNDVVVAALLHDIGKRHSRFGVVRRSIASLMILGRLPLSDRMTTYRDHGIIGAKELADLGAPGLAIEFALHHHGARPVGFDPAIWKALEDADEPAKARGGRSQGILSAW
jgi:putative nucleotidyltransferase with HDIG domain